jgi:hypothetical protein
MSHTTDTRAKTIAKVIAGYEYQAKHGTAFLVSEKYALTALHVVADRTKIGDQGKPVFIEPITLYFIEANNQERCARPVEGCWHILQDWVLLELCDPKTANPKFINLTPLPLSNVTPLPRGELTKEDEHKEWKSIGYPAVGVGNITAAGGSIRYVSGRWENVHVYQLFCAEAGAGQGEKLEGLSGAPCLINDVVVGVIRASNVEEVQQSGARGYIQRGGIVYACPITSIYDRCCHLLSVVDDPIRGLPGIPNNILNEPPFFYLESYKEDQAELFFGRNQEIKELYNKIISLDSQQLILVYGASGVGKSSLLEAGLIPRLRITCDLQIGRRKREVNLSDILNELAKDWENCSQEIGYKNTVVILDQIEEVYTDESTNGSEQILQLAIQIRELIKRASGKNNKIVLSFRKEWFANIRDTFKKIGIAYTEFFLKPLEREGIEEVVNGIQSTKRLRLRYGVEVDDELSKLIATDLIKGHDSTITPFLSIILTDLYKSIENDPVSERRLTVEAYQTNSYPVSKILERFFNDRLKSVINDYPDENQSGLILDLLNYHITEFQTADTVLFENDYNADAKDKNEDKKKSVSTIYSHINRERINRLLESLIRHHLLHTILRNSNGSLTQTRLVHDTLAPIVNTYYVNSEKPGQRARRILETQANEWKNGNKDPLSKTDLKIVNSGLNGMRNTTPKENEILAHSNKKARLESHVFYSSAIIVILSVVISTYLFYENNKTKSQNLVNIQYSNLISKVKYEISEHNTTGIILAAEAAARRPDDYEVMSLILQVFSSEEMYKEVIQIDYKELDPNDEIISFASTNEKRVIITQKGMLGLFNQSGNSDWTYSFQNPEYRIQQNLTKVNIALSKNNKWIAISFADQSVYLFNASKPEPIILNKGKKKIVDCSVKPYSIENNDTSFNLKECPNLKPLVLAFNEDSKLLAFADESQNLSLWNIDDQTKKWNKNIDIDTGASIEGISFRPRTNIVVTLNNSSNTIQQWNVFSGKFEGTLPKIEGKSKTSLQTPLAYSFAHDKYLVNNKIKSNSIHDSSESYTPFILWDSQTKDVINISCADDSNCSDDIPPAFPMVFSFAPDNYTFTTIQNWGGSRAKGAIIRIHDIGDLSKNNPNSSEIENEYIVSARFSDKSDKIILESSSGAKKYILSHLKKKIFDSVVNKSDYDPDFKIVRLEFDSNNKIVSIDNKGILYIHNLDDLSNHHELLLDAFKNDGEIYEHDRFFGLAWSHKYIFAQNQLTSIKFWKLIDNKVENLDTIQPLNGEVFNEIVIDKNAEYAAVLTSTKNIIMFKIGENSVQELTRLDVENVMHIDFSPSGKFFTAMTKNGDVYLWQISNVENKRVDKTLHIDSYAVNEDTIDPEDRMILFSPDEKYLLAKFPTYSRGKAVLWNIESESIIFEDQAAHCSYKFYQDKLFAADFYNGISSFDLLTQEYELITQNLGTPNQLFSSCNQTSLFPEKGLFILSDTYGGPIYIFDYLNKLPIGTINIDSIEGGYPIQYTYFTPDSKWLIVYDQNASLFSIPWGTSKWVDSLCEIANKNMNQKEWADLFPFEEYRKTCPKLM